MDPQEQFCHNSDCSERGVVGRGNIVIHSRAEQRYQCRRCKRTFRDDGRHAVLSAAQAGRAGGAGAHAAELWLPDASHRGGVRA